MVACKKFKDGGKMTDKDNAILAHYKAALDYDMSKNPTKETFDRIKELIDVLEPAGTEAGKVLQSRKLLAPQEDNLTNFLIDKQMNQGFGLSEKQIKEESAKYVELQKANKELKSALEKEKEENAKLIAEIGLNKAKAQRRKEAKKSKEEYKKDRDDTVQAARDALKKLRDGGLQSSVL